MADARRARQPLILTLLALAALWCVLGADAQISIVWRAVVVSWDSPATQLHDDVATQGIVYLDAARHLRDQMGAALRPAGRLAAAPDHARGDSPALTSRLTRSPPER
jgi:hypothetical protein